MRDEFETLGRFLQAAISAEGMDGPSDPRLLRQAVASGHGEAVGTEGGFLVPPDFASQIWERAFAFGRILQRCERLPLTRGNTLVVPAIDQTNRAAGSWTGGVRLSWTAEGQQIADSELKFAQVKLALRKLAGLAYITDEMLQDGPALEAAIVRLFGLEAAAVIEDSIVNGSGAGVPLGVMNSAALITVPKVAGQPADTVLPANTAAMMARFPASSRPTGVWLCSVETEAALAQSYTTVTEAGAAVGGVPSPHYRPAGADGCVYATIGGMAIIPCEYTARLGDKGDLILADFSQYAVAEKEPGILSSIHVRFIHDETGIRFILRVDGAPLWNSPLTQRNSTLTASPFVTLAERA